MKVLNFKDFMKKYNLKDNTMNEKNYREIRVILYTPEILKDIQIEDLLFKIMDLKVGLTGQLFTLRITNHSTLIVSVVNQINFY